MVFSAVIRVFSKYTLFNRRNGAAPSKNGETHSLDSLLDPNLIIELQMPRTKISYPVRSGYNGEAVLDVSQANIRKSGFELYEVFYGAEGEAPFRTALPLNIARVDFDPDFVRHNGRPHNNYRLGITNIFPDRLRAVAVPEGIDEYYWVDIYLEQ